RLRAAPGMGVEARRNSLRAEEGETMRTATMAPARTLLAGALMIAIGASAPASADYFICQPNPDGGVPTSLKCACSEPRHCFAPGEGDNPESQLEAPRGAPTGDYECCHTGRTCTGDQVSTVIAEDLPGCTDLRWPCFLGTPCANGPGACHGTCRGNPVTI